MFIVLNNTSWKSKSGGWSTNGVNARLTADVPSGAVLGTGASMFKILGALLALYVARCIVAGDVYGRSGLWGRSWRRDEDALGYWSAVGAYGALMLMLFFLF